MLHEHRRFHVAVVASAEELAEKLTGHTWTLCTGFELSGILFLNDSFSEDGAQEYAVIRQGRQVESITFGWCATEQAARYIRDVLAGKTVDTGPCATQIDYGDHVCDLCR